MNVFISAPLFDLDGTVSLTKVSPDGLAGFQRRNNRIATLDGGAAIPDFGYSEADRTFDIRWNAISEPTVEAVRRMAKSYSRLIVSTKEGCYLGAPGPFNLSNGEAQFQILVEKRLDQ
ncbi:hypothetical protein [Marinobacter salarius]|jgi:hypothetical protein|uniref:hypothetical protein n=1 Tax=Marinobacter salarius TaxID=1420917 RepID=UPI0010AB2A67|nr:MULTISPECIES: hypothetical protein [Marinobacter]MBJ7302564.1 hypothetical protein [Marinobacter salarius]HIO30719.1 hypothetical protein [Marinobacter salarius]HIP01782.1 hypothetical protein [Marinobacter salarius]